MRGPITVGNRVWALPNNSYLWHSSDGFAACEGFFGGDWVFFGGKRLMTVLATINHAETAQNAFEAVNDRLDEIRASWANRQ